MQRSRNHRLIWPCFASLAPIGAWCGAIALGLMCLGIAAGIVLAQEKDQPPTDAANKPTAEREASQDSSTATASHSPAERLAREQAELASRFKQLRRMMLHLSEFSSATDPHRANVLRQAIANTEEEELVLKFEAIVQLLEKQQLAQAEKNQLAVRAQLDKLLQLLLKEDRANRLDTEKKRIETLIREVGRMIKDQRGVKARTEGGDDLPKLSEAQQKIVQKAVDLAEQLARDEAEKASTPGDGAEAAQAADSAGNDQKKSQPAQGEKSDGGKAKPGETDRRKTVTPAEKEKPLPPAEGTPPEPLGDAGESGAGQPGKQSQDGNVPAEQAQSSGETQPGSNQPGSPQSGTEGEPAGDQPPQEESENMRVRKRIAAARERMEEAERKLREAEREGATEKQQQALDELEQAKAELEKILRQLREEEVERVLAQLEDRFRAMLKRQIEVYEGTQRLDKIAANERGRDDEIEAGRLSRLQAQIVHDADRCLQVLRDEGSAVAFPEAVGQMRDDMEQIAARLAQFKTDRITQGLEEDVIAALEELVAALKRAQQELEEKQNQGQSPAQTGEPGDQALVDKLAELRMIRALQMRVNKRTQLLSEMISGEQADDPELLKSLDDLAERQLRIKKVTRDLHLGKNE